MRLTALEPEDLDLVYTIENDTSIWDVSSINVPYSRYALREYIASQHHDIYVDGQVRFVVRTTPEDGLGDNEQAVGLVDLFNYQPQHERAEVGYAILARYRNHGLCTEALRRLVEYARLSLHLHSLYATVSSTHDASIRVLQHCGFTHSATLRQWFHLADGYHDAIVMQLILQ